MMSVMFCSVAPWFDKSACQAWASASVVGGGGMVKKPLEIDVPAGAVGVSEGVVPLWLVSDDEGAGWSSLAASRGGAPLGITGT